MTGRFFGDGQQLWGFDTFESWLRASVENTALEQTGRESAISLGAATTFEDNRGVRLVDWVVPFLAGLGACDVTEPPAGR
jgi:hypothetical protein